MKPAAKSPASLFFGSFPTVNAGLLSPLNLLRLFSRRLSARPSRAQRLANKRNDANRLYRRCPKCGRQHYLTSIELSFYTAQNAVNPVHCRICRKTVAASVFDGEAAKVPAV